MGIAMACQVVNAAPVNVPDFSFEDTFLGIGGGTAAPNVGPDWTASGNGGVFLTGVSGTDFAGPPLPPPGDGTNYVVENINGHTARCWQDIGALQSNTVYTLSVAVGNSSNNATGQGFIGLVNGTSPFGTLLASAPIDSSTVPVGTFTDFTLVFTNGYQASGALTILMEGDTGAQILYDNVRLDATRTPPAAQALPITSNPATNTVFVGTVVTFNENPAGTPPFSYQWQTDSGSGGATWSNTGGNSNNLVVDTSSFSPNTAIAFQVIVSNGSGPSTSAPVSLTAINSQPVVTSQTVPALGSDVAGSSVTFSAQFQGTLPISYQWFFQDLNGDPVVPITGATDSTLAIDDLDPTNAGFYYLAASNSIGGPINSAQVLFFVTNAIVTNGISISEANQCGLGGLTDFGTTWAVVTNNDLLLGLAPSFAGGNFEREGASGGAGVAVLTDGSFGELPPEGNAGTGVVTGGNQGGTNVTYLLPTNSLGWDLTNITVYGGWSDTGRDDQRYAVYYFTPANHSVLTPIANIDYRPESTTIDSTPITIPGQQSATRVSILSATNGVLTHNAAGIVVVFDPGSDNGENNYEGYAEIQAFGTNSTTVIPPPPNVSANVGSAFDVVGNSLTLTATISSVATYTLQWYKDGVAISGATNSSLTLSNLQLSDSSTSPGYTVTASSIGGMTTSTAVPVTVNPVPSPDGNSVVQSFAAQTGNQSPFTASWSVAPGSLIAGEKPSYSGPYGNQGFGTEGCAGVNVLTDGQPGSFNGANQTLAVGGSGAGQNLVYTLANSTVGYNISNIVVYGGWGDNGRNAQDYTVSYSTVANPTNFIVLDTVALDPTATQPGWNSSSSPNATRVTLTSGSGGLLASNVYAVQFNFNVADKNGYQGYGEIQIFGAQGSAVPNLPPALAQDILPAAGSDVVGSSVTFTANFVGSPPLSYQWYFDGNPISGATGPALTVNDLQSTNSGNYYVFVSNASGSAYSSTNAFTVNAAPSPVNGTLNAQAYQLGYANSLNNVFGLTPTWALASGSLIAGQSPSSLGSGNFNDEGCGGVSFLTDGVQETLADANWNMSSCGPGAGQSVTYSLTGSANGYNLKSIVVYGGWTDAGRNENGFQVAYATASNPNTFVALTSPQTTFDFKPGGPAIPNATRQTITSATASALAQNVVAVRISFTSEENGWCGFGQIQLFGTVTVPPTSPKFTSTRLAGGNLIVMGSNGSPETGYTLLSTTNVALPISQWITNTTGMFDGSGGFSNALGVTPTNEFFLLRSP